MRLANVYFHSGHLSSGGFIHPEGDGWRAMIVLTDGDDVILLSPSTLQSARVSSDEFAQWRSRDLPFDPPLLRGRMLEKLSYAYAHPAGADIEAAQRASAEIMALLSPPPRVRTRTAVPAP